MNRETTKKLSLLSAVLILCASGCGNNSPSSSLSEHSESEVVTETTTTQESTTTTTKRTTSTTTTSATVQTTESPTQEPTEESLSEREILEAVSVDMYGENSMIDYEHHLDYLIRTAEALSDRYLGNISDEEDLIEKARSIWIERLGAEYIERIESDYIERDGQKIKYERSRPPYYVKYYDEYDAWWIEPNAPAGVTEDGMRFDTPSMPPYFIVRGEDGMIMGALI